VWIDPMIIMMTMLEWYAWVIIALLFIGVLADWWLGQ
jgi:hypothetical protein